MYIYPMSVFKKNRVSRFLRTFLEHFQTADRREAIYLGIILAIVAFGFTLMFAHGQEVDRRARQYFEMNPVVREYTSSGSGYQLRLQGN